MEMIITLKQNDLDKILNEVNAKGSGYNRAWLDGYLSLAQDLKIIKWDYTANKYVLA